MVKNKKFVVILAVSVLGAVLLTGCGAGAGGETGLKGKAESTGSQAVEAKATGTVKKVDSAAGKVTITTEGGADLVLDVSSKEMLANLAGLVNKTGTQVTVDYDTGTKTVTNINTQAETRAQATATGSGTLKAVDAATGTVTIATKSGGELVLKVTDESKILVGGSRATLVQLAAKIGSGVSVDYHAETKTATSVNIQG